MIVTTTPSVEGYRIIRYFPPVVTNLVVGTGLLGDIAAGFSDFFGGRSETYQTHLAEMYAAAVRDLESKAAHAGANCLVGVHFDLSQISGKGMQMLMLNAVGTPVTIATDAEIREQAETGERERVEREAQAAERRERFVGATSLQGLLSDPEIARQARSARRAYGRGVCASFLNRKAEELGMGDLGLTEDDIPDTF